eukprot:CAMPEP_0202700596 /NCGR_PEP_ID=MMETSP1385-20130828/13775_1 /ASSEMBLY_ACC=CAM_ASM_000861 /TAXON_ID=933848 /ORGANISM="Elphidium margaritaceum" /LENGTH=392 /DNA_ID=CAMNT_0049357817 /DNA_START=123 /DNA_END=1301 /DNA_ORIENTATION=+
MTYSVVGGTIATGLACTCNNFATVTANTTTATTTPAVDQTNFHDMVKEYYGQTLQTSADLKTSACCTAKAPPLVIREALKKIPAEINDKYYGCGSPLPFGLQGLTVLDLGSGSGRDCYVAAQLVGEHGNVIGIDMTDEQLAVSRKYANDFCTKTLGYKKSNLSFIKGYIEMLPQYLEPNSVDIIISNCVVNLSPRKDQVLSGAFDVLKEGGEFYFSDVYCDRRLSEEIQNHKVLVGECLGGALYIEDFRRLCQNVGFKDPRILSVSEITVEDAELKRILGNAKFYSITYRLFKHGLIEDKCEDYGQVAIYKGSIAEHPDGYDLDDHHKFITNKPMLVCGNTANMVGDTWLKHHFDVIGDMSTHYGLFDCSPVANAASKSDSDTNAKVGGSCC